MKRDPAIHVKRSFLIEAIDNLIQESRGEFAEMTGEEITALLFHVSKRDAIRNRVMLQPNAKTKKRMERIVSVDKNLAEDFHAVYQQVNLANSIKTTSIKATDGKYATLKEVALHAKEFCDMFEIEQHPGFKAYVTMGIQLAGNNYSIYRLKSLGDRIINQYKNLLTIDEDPDPDSTTKFVAAWKVISIKYLGSAASVTEPHLYVNFIHGREAADKHKADYLDWISAQFERFAFMNSSPELTQLFGDNAELAYTKYTGSKNKEYGSDEEKKYFEQSKVTTKKIVRKDSKKETGV